MKRCFNWTGLLIEGNPENFGKLKRSGRHAALEHSAVCSPPLSAVNFSVGGSNFAGVVDAMPTTLRHRAIQLRYGARTVAVPCSPLHSLLRRHGFERADFFSLDVEGAEKVVLESLDRPAGRYFSTILVEADGRDPSKDEGVDRLARAAERMRRGNLVVRNSRAYLQTALTDMWPKHSWLAERRFAFKPTAKQIHEAVVEAVRVGTGDWGRRTYM